MSDELCPCGQPLHYRHEGTRKLVDDMIERYGECTIVTLNGRSWRVPRHYIALHGLQAWKMPSLGFEEVTDKHLHTMKPKRTTCKACGQRKACLHCLGFGWICRDCHALESVTS